MLKIVLTSFVGDIFFGKNYVGRKIVFESKFKDCKAVVRNMSSFFETSHHFEIGIFFKKLEIKRKVSD